MKKFLFGIFLLCLSFNVCIAQEDVVHPIDKQEAECRALVSSVEDITKCTAAAARAWNSEVDRYYALLHRRLLGDDKQNIFESQKYWLLNKNFDVKVINSLNVDDNESKAVFRAEQKRNLAKNRAENLRLYYIKTFSDDDTENIQKGSQYSPDNYFIRGLRYLAR